MMSNPKNCEKKPRIILIPKNNALLLRTEGSGTMNGGGGGGGDKFFNSLSLLGPQSRFFGDNGGQMTWNLSGESPKRDWSSRRVNNIKNMAY